MTDISGIQLKQKAESMPGHAYGHDYALDEPYSVKILARSVDMRNGIDEDRWATYGITLLCSNCFFTSDGRSLPWWAVKKWKEKP